MYVRKATRRRYYRVSLLALAVVVLAPKVEVPAVPQLAAVLGAVGLEFPEAG
jgi:hypothetical protein